MTRVLPLAIILLGLLAGCSQANSPQDPIDIQQEEADALAQRLDDLHATAAAVSCTDASTWRYTSTGDKACGGPSGYIAYPVQIDTLVFLQRVEAHRQAERAFNLKWGVTSDCEVHPEPIGIACEGSEAVLLYR